jgi:GTP-binding protein Era
MAIGEANLASLAHRGEKVYTTAVFRSGFCAIIGRPNVGKSTLLNQVLGEKLAVVTPKPQTTRNRILGVKNRKDAQLVLVDTPGVHRGKSNLNKYMVDQALAAAGECDVVLYMVEAPRVAAATLADKAFDPGEGNQLIMDKLATLKCPVILGINKVDLLADKMALLPLIDHYTRLGQGKFREIVPISARGSDGLDRLEDAIVACLPEGPALFPEEMLTDRAERFLAAELVREQLFLKLGQEVPYSTAVTVESWKERPDKGDVVIDALIHVERESQRKIVIGQNGTMVKEIGMKARAEISRLLGLPVHLKLLVKIEPDWTSKPGALRRLGYE